jgi:hypothetical protein
VIVSFQTVLTSIMHVPDHENHRERHLAANPTQLGLPVQGALTTRDGTVAGPLHA